MKDAHLSIRIPTELDRALERRATADAAPKSQLVREAVSRYLDPPPSGTSPDGSTPRRPTGRMLAERWPTLPHLERADADALASDISDAKASLPDPCPPWE